MPPPIADMPSFMQSFAKQTSSSSSSWQEESIHQSIETHMNHEHTATVLVKVSTQTVDTMQKWKGNLFSCKKFIVEPKEQKYGTEEEEGGELKLDEIVLSLPPVRSSHAHQSARN
jgi:hypothetical protein